MGEMTMRTGKPPMTAAEARENIAAMKAETSLRSQRQLLRHAINPRIGNLGAEARAIYAARLAELDA